MKLLWKDEGNEGPLWFTDDSGQIIGNYEDSGEDGFSGAPRAKWFTLAGARRIAKRLNLPLETT